MNSLFEAVYRVHGCRKINGLISTVQKASMYYHGYLFATRYVTFTESTARQPCSIQCFLRVCRLLGVPAVSSGV